MDEIHRRELGGRVAALAVTRDGQRVAAYVLGKQGRVVMWDSGDDSGELTEIHTDVGDLSGTNAYACLEFSPDGNRLAGCAADRDWLQQPDVLLGKARVWEFTAPPAQQPAPRLAFVNPHGDGRGEDFLIPNNNVIYATSAKNDGTLYLYDVDDGVILSAMGFGEGTVLRQLMLSADREWLVIGQTKAESEQQIFDAHVRHSILHPPRGTIPDCERVLGLSVHGEEIAVLRGSRIELWDTVKAELIRQAPFQHTRIDAVQFSPDGRMLAISDQDTLVLWQWQQDEYERIELGRSVSSLAFTPDGRFLAEGPAVDDEIQIREIGTGQIIRRLSSGRSLSVPHLAFAQGGRMLIACDMTADNGQEQNQLERPRIFMWDTADSSLAHSIAVPGVPHSFDVSPNELYLVSRVVGRDGSKLMGWRLDGKQAPTRSGNEAPAAEARP